MCVHVVFEHERVMMDVVFRVLFILAFRLPVALVARLGQLKKVMSYERFKYPRSAITTRL